MISCNNRAKTDARKKFNLKMVAAAIFLTAFTAGFLYNPERYSAKCLEGIVLWAQGVLPTLFPFMIVCALFFNMGFASKTPAPLKKLCTAIKLPPCAAACFMLGASSGYPAGSRTVREFYAAGLTDARGARKLAVLCTACGPIFAIATAGGMFGGDAGIKLYAAHITSVLVTAVIFSLCTGKCSGGLPQLKRQENVLEASFYQGVKSALMAGAFIAFSYTMAAMAEDFYVLLPLNKFLSLFLSADVAAAFSRGLVEMTGGIASLAACGGKLPLALAGFSLTFGGACVLAQQLAYLTYANVRPAFFITAKFVQGLACFGLLLLIG